VAKLKGKATRFGLYKSPRRHFQSRVIHELSHPRGRASGSLAPPMAAPSKSTKPSAVAPCNKKPAYLGRLNLEHERIWSIVLVSATYGSAQASPAESTFNFAPA